MRKSRGHIFQIAVYLVGCDWLAWFAGHLGTSGHPVEFRFFNFTTRFFVFVFCFFFFRVRFFSLFFDSSVSLPPLCWVLAILYDWLGMTLPTSYLLSYLRLHSAQCQFLRASQRLGLTLCLGIVLNAYRDTAGHAHSDVQQTSTMSGNGLARSNGRHRNGFYI